MRKIRSIKRTSFYTMLKGSLAVVFAVFFIICIFAVTISYLLITSHEDNLSKVLINSFNEKQERILNISKSLSNIIETGASESEKKLFLENSVGIVKDIKGILILNEQGIITDVTSGYEAFAGLDFSGKDYYRSLMENKGKEYLIPNSYVSHKTKNITLNVVTPIIKDNKTAGMVVMIISPSILANSNLKGLEYYLVDTNGDIIFKSYEGNVIDKEDNIKDSLIMQQGLKAEKSLFYRDKISGKLVLGHISKDSFTDKYIVVQYHIFGDPTIFSGLAALLVFFIMFSMVFVLFISSEASSVITNYINIFKNQVHKVSTGNYDAKVENSYPIEEINDIVDNFNNMAHKIKLREEELQAYNEELIAANDEIKVMLSSLSKSEKEKKDQYLQIIWTMVNLLEIKDEYTAGHSKAVTYYAEEISEKLNRDFGFNINVESIQVAAMLHDIGKIGIDREILNKPSRLTREEYDVIKTHPSKGFYALKDIESMQEERKIIKYHHERMDGSGYPEGLSGEQVPLGARIIGVADAFDAMVSDRPYRKGMPLEMAIGELERNRGTQFDSLIVDVFVSMLREGQFEAAQDEAQ